LDDGIDEAHLIDDFAALEARYGTPVPTSVVKEVPRLTTTYRRWLQQSPFFVIASVGPAGLDASPRGDAADQAFALVDDATLLIPDRRGNNRLDTLRNIVRDPRVALLFFVPGVAETMRINGRARISVEPQLLDRFAVAGKTPATVLVVRTEAVYFQCARALVRSSLWQPRPAAATVPTAGQMLAEVQAGFDDAAYDADAPARVRATLY
jgi:PPOX class probable FMN-dependent enzyme